MSLGLRYESLTECSIRWGKATVLVSVVCFWLSCASSRSAVRFGGDGSLQTQELSELKTVLRYVWAAKADSNTTIDEAVLEPFAFLGFFDQEHAFFEQTKDHVLVDDTRHWNTSDTVIATLVLPSGTFSCPNNQKPFDNVFALAVPTIRSWKVVRVWRDIC